MGTDEVVDKAQDIARDTNDHPVVRALARTGYVASGIMHLLIAWLGVRLALGTARGSVDQSAALGWLANTSWGRPLLWVLAAGFVGLALWQLTEALSGIHGRGSKAVMSRGKAVAKAVIYAVLAFTSAQFARGIRSQSGRQTSDATDTALHLPGGGALVALAAVVVAAVGVYHVVKGLRHKFLEDLVEDPGSVAVLAGTLGYCAKGVAFVVAGGLVLVAALQKTPETSTGLGGALAWILKLPFGPWLLIVVAVGIGCYGVYSFFRARYTRV